MPETPNVNRKGASRLVMIRECMVTKEEPDRD